MAVSDVLRAFKQAAWVGWKVESNWTDPMLFVIYYMIRPISGLLIVGFIYIIGSMARGAFAPHYFAYLFIGTSFFTYVFHITLVMSYLIHEDRARYEVLKHIYIAPKSIHPYLLGRAAMAAADGTVSLLITFGFGLLIFGRLIGVTIPIDFSQANYPALVASTSLGIVSLISVGYILSGINLVSSRLQWTLSEYVAGAFFLLGGVVFPPDVLPELAQTISRALPITYFLSAARRSLLGAQVEEIVADLTSLAVTAAATALVGMMVFAWAEGRARRLGLIDRKAEY